MPQLRRTGDGRALLNVGCGATFSEDWTNVDIARRTSVIRHDLRQPLPFEDVCFDGVYAAHVLEHLDERDGSRLLGELYRVTKPAGIIRIVVPDFERACREYLARLDEVCRNAGTAERRRHRWSVLEIVDQFSRRKPGGMMLDTLRTGDIDSEYVNKRNGAEFESWLAAPQQVDAAAVRSPAKTKIGPMNTAKQWIYRQRFRVGDGLGELHRSAYDRFSLPEALSSAGFEDISVVSFDESRISSWSAFGLDVNPASGDERKPDSLYVEGLRRRPQ